MNRSECILIMSLFVAFFFFEEEKNEKFEYILPLFLSRISINTLLYHYSNCIYDERTYKRHLETAGHTFVCRVQLSFFRIYSN